MMADLPRPDHDLLRHSRALGSVSGARVVDPRPAAAGRWQPTRAGAVNSWAWTDEQFLFHHGWSALVGPNGSGKSVTGEMLFPTLIDGDVTPKGLSIKGIAAGTLGDRHTNWNVRSAKTGLWWQEFGRVHTADAAESETDWLTVGLWLHRAGGAKSQVERAWFLAPARVGQDLALTQDRDPVSMEDLAQQLAECGGRLFASAERLTKAASQHLRVVTGEAGYRDAVREILYAPMDYDQIEGLAAVLRALRSVQVNQRISPESMQETLTSALPTLDVERVERLAKALTKTEQLQQQLQGARDELDTLTPIQAAYRRYAGAVAALASARMLESWRQHHQEVKQRQELARQRDEQQHAKDDAEHKAAELHSELQRLDQTIDLLRQKASGHKGAGLPQLEEHATQLENNTNDAVETAERAVKEAEQARHTSGEHDARAHGSVTHVRSLVGGLAEEARQAHAAAYCERIAETTETVVSEKAAEDPQQDQNLIDEVHATLQAWAGSRLAALGNVREANAELRSAQKARDKADDRVALARAEGETATDAASAAQEATQAAESAVVSLLGEFTAGLRRLQQPPSALLQTTAIDLDAITSWADTALQEAMAVADAPGARARAESAADAETKARQEADNAQAAAAAAAQDADASADALLTCADPLPEPPPPIAALAAALRAIDDADPEDLPRIEGQIGTIASAARQELETRKEALHQASALLNAFDRARQQSQQDDAAADRAASTAETARQAADATERRAAREAADWARRVHEWVGALRVIDPSQLPLPAPEQPATADPDQLADEVVEAHRRASNNLAAELATAEASLAEASTACDRLDAEITAAQRTDPAPEAPAWRSDRSHRAGAPLWAVVDFADSLPVEPAGQLEGALLAAGLLDAWVNADGELASGDVHLVPTAPLAGRTLADLLVPDPGSVVPTQRVQALLASIRVTDGEPDDGSPVVVDLAGTARSGLLAARGPADWAPRHIGPTARERNRQRRLGELRAQRAELETTLTQATTCVEQAHTDIAAADQERSALPNASMLARLRSEAQQRADEAQRSTQAAETATSTAQRSADQASTAWAAATQACLAAKVAPDPHSVEAAATAYADLPELVTATELRGQNAATTSLAARSRAREADDATTKRAEADQAATQAQQAVDEALSEREQLPDFDPVRRARQEANEASRKATDAADAASVAQAELGSSENAVKKALTALHKASRTEDGHTVPTDPTQAAALQHHVETMKEHATGWVAAVGRAQVLVASAVEHRRVADSAQQRAAHAASRAQRLASESRAARHRYDEERRLHGTDYQQLLDELAARRGEHEQKTTAHKQEQDKTHTADRRLAANEANLARAEERRRQAERELDRAVTTMRLLFDEGLITDVADSQALPRPDTVDAASTTAKTILAGRGLTAEEPVDKRETALGRALRELDTRIRNVRDKLFRIGRHIELEEVPETGWRQVVITEQSHTPASATSTKSLQALLDELARSIHTLESDFDEQLRIEVKGAIFTDLRKHINIRIALAEQIVADIQKTLKDVRTGVARVGIELDWQPRKDDPVASEAISLIRDANSEGEFDRMYDFFIRLLSAEDQTATSTEQIQRVFDYRDWYRWEIRVTHAEFAGPNEDGEVFRKVSSRKNPLDTLSTGEKRLATMLPLLAAARAFYSADGYHGPRMIFIDELDAAFDTPNLRMMLALLRNWEFDVMTTLPSMPPLLAAEAGAVAIHKIGKHGEGYRYTVPCLWEGHGQPHTARIHVGSHTSHHPRVNKPAGAPNPAQNALFDTKPGIP